MPNKDKPLVDRHAPKDGVGWLMNDREGKVYRFANDMATVHAQWVEVETRPMQGGGQPVIRRCSDTTLFLLGKRCRNQAGGSDARLSGEESQSAVSDCRAPIKNPALRRGKCITQKSLGVKHIV